ncbi:hypothetical protein [Micromonospora mirobrigensis]|uniref:Uncharacterized protein n=1 Tax=Micromonospora mirobrigensis TaxID=262898 RepID=A0A1C4V0G2_9ACTN|nr:hypothetical protein [Micromonospora mirobrigensis]SCE77319.1 hypothetical protein GA0070564_101852 [Micromonospora mirobrigensis]
MARVDVRPVARAGGRRTAPLLAAALAAGVLAAAAAAPGWATAAPTVTGVVTAATDPAEVATDPATDPVPEPTTTTSDPEPTTTTSAPDPTTAPPTVSAPPETTAPAPAPTTTTTAPAPASTTTAPAPGVPAPATTSPTVKAPAPPPAVPPAVPALPPAVPGAPPAAPGVPPAAPAAPPAAPGQQPQGQVGVAVTTGDVVLTPAYWNADRTVTSLRVTVANTGTVTEQIRLGYKLPAGLTDAGTPGCAPADGGYRCGEWTTAPGARFSALIRVRVRGDAWRSMPLSGAVRVVARAPSVNGTSVDDEGFAVLFPPGPPVPGISLHADPPVFDISGEPTVLTVRLGNTGKADARGRIEVTLPAGVTVPTLPTGCVDAGSGRTRCDTGTVAAGSGTELRLTVAATPQAQRLSPLAGAVAGQLDPRNGRSRQMQMSFRITAAAALATPPVATPTPTGSQGVLAAAGQRGGGDEGLSGQQTALALIAVSALLVALALGLATTSLRRRFTDPPAETASAATD